ncbi:MAG: hypothetical protein A2Y17_05645 [Clostridiales bacterium GWF2_38_85]|nr:MAG: hypothetical protein A2Y17_05645 [Clostridiales bacterium GWF2_38_85]HBL84035.1 hypothetical protein [Clostridiales bacterium]
MGYTIFEKIIAVFIAIAAWNSTTVSNYFFSDQKMPVNSQTEQFLTDTLRNEDKLLDYLFPTDGIDDNFIPPYNLTYTIAEFQKFKGTYLQKTEAVGSSYFDDTILLGDSLTFGLQLNGLIPSDKVLAIVGKGVYNILDSETTLTASSEKKKVIDLLTDVQPKKIYVNMGTNGVSDLTNEQHMVYYNKMLDRIKTACPSATIILVAISPWSEIHSEINTKINHFNMYLLETAKSSGMYFVNAAEALMNGKGALPDSYCSSGDGIHWNYAAQTAYMNYLKTHTIYQ